MRQASEETDDKYKVVATDAASGRVAAQHQARPNAMPFERERHAGGLSVIDDPSGFAFGGMVCACFGVALFFPLLFSTVPSM